MRLDLLKEKDSNWHLDDKLIPLSHQKNTFGLIYTRGSPSISARFVVRIRKIKDEKKKKEINVGTPHGPLEVRCT